MLIGACLSIGGCTIGVEPDDPYTGKMNDYTYGGQIEPGQVTSRINAAGRRVSVDQFKGRFVWADYAAPWCGPCAPQAQAIKALESRHDKQVVFLTVMTSKAVGYGNVPDQQTARAWSQRFGLDPQRVVAADNLWGMTIPTHILYSPSGQTLYRSTGYLPAQQITEILNHYREDWERWDRNGEMADWMRFD